jgi:hypothetical protein
VVHLKLAFHSQLHITLVQVRDLQKSPLEKDSLKKENGLILYQGQEIITINSLQASLPQQYQILENPLQLNLQKQKG